MRKPNIATAAIFLGAFALIGFAIYVTRTLWPLLALVFLPFDGMREDIDFGDSDE